jgi:hypothetical protein
MILEKYPLRKHLIAFNKPHILDDEDASVVGVKEKKSFHKRKRNDVDFEGFISRIQKVLLMESVNNVSASIYCVNCCQHFFHAKTLLLRQKFWSLSFEDCRTHGLNIPRRLHMRGDGGWQKFITIQGVDVCETAWY